MPGALEDIRVIDFTGRMLQLFYDARGNIVRMVDAAGQTYLYSYDANIGLAPGDYIVAVNGNEIASSQDLNNALISSTERSSVVLDVARGRFIYSLTFPMSV